jgi:L-amino acid N-acyltransferase YncA
LAGRSILVRDGLLSDVADVTDIYRHAVLFGTGTFELDPPDHDEMAARFRRITGQGYPYLVACQNTAIVGYAYAFTYRDRPAYRFTVEDSVYVREDCHGRGIGTMLLSRLLTDAEAKGFRQMVAVIGDSDNIGSIKLHERAGFLPLGTLRAAGWKRDRWLDVVLMQKPLGAGDETPPKQN